MASPECKLSHKSYYQLSGRVARYVHIIIMPTSPFPPPSRGKFHSGKSGKCSLRQYGKCSLRQIRQMFTLASPANVHFGKCSLRQVREMFTLANVHFGKCSLWQVREMFTSANVHFGKSGKQPEHIMQALYEDDGRCPGTPWALGGKTKRIYNRI